jgi:hypothetical protein
MSVTTMAPRADEYAETWRQWQIGNANSTRTAAIRARMVFAVGLTVAIVWLALQLLASPVWL